MLQLIKSRTIIAAETRRETKNAFCILDAIISLFTCKKNCSSGICIFIHSLRLKCNISSAYFCKQQWKKKNWKQFLHYSYGQWVKFSETNRKPLLMKLCVLAVNVFRINWQAPLVSTQSHEIVSQWGKRSFDSRKVKWACNRLSKGLFVMIQTIFKVNEISNRRKLISRHKLSISSWNL